MKDVHFKCPICSSELSVMLLMGTIPDGYVCPKCKLYFAPDEKGEPMQKPLAKVI